MTTSNVFIINPAADFEDQLEAVRGLLFLSSDGVRAMADCVTPSTNQAIRDINSAVVEWLDVNLKAEIKRRSSGPHSARARSLSPLAVAAE